MAYKKFTGGGGDFFKFEADGDTIEGRVLGFKDTKYGLACAIETTEGVKMIGCNTSLINCFNEAFGSTDKVPHGAKVQVTFTGWEKTKGGQDFRKFEIAVDEDDLEKVPF